MKYKQISLSPVSQIVEQVVLESPDVISMGGHRYWNFVSLKIVNKS